MKRQVTTNSVEEASKVDWGEEDTVVKKKVSRIVLEDEEMKIDVDTVEEVNKMNLEEKDNELEKEWHKFLEGIFRFAVPNLQDQLRSVNYYSSIYKVNNEKWRLLVKFIKEYVEVYLVWIPSRSLPSKIYCEYEFKLVNTENITDSFRISSCEEFTTSSDVHGFDLFILREELMNPKNMYIHNGELIIECHIACGSVEFILPQDVKRPATPHEESNTIKLEKAERAKYLLDNSEGCDCEFEVSDGKQTVHMSASKFVLARASPVFQSMFVGPFAKEKTIQVTDIEINAFQKLLYYVHDAVWEFESQAQAISVCYAAKKYGLNDLELLCINYMWPKSVSDVWLAFNCAVKFQFLDMEKAALDIIQKYHVIIFEDKCFCEISQESLQRLVQKNQLAVPEIELFKAVLQWAKFQCRYQGLEICGPNLRSVTGDALRHIRFLAMTAEQFAGSPCESGMLTAEETAIVLRRMVTGRFDIPLPYLSCLTKQRLNKYP